MPGYKNWIAGDVLNAADINDYANSQAVMRFADTTARDTALSTVKTSGMVAYTTTDKTLWMYDGSNWQQYGAVSAWTTSTPTLTNVTGGTVSMRSTQIGRSLFFSINLSAGTATAAGTVTITTAYTSAAVTTPVNALIFGGALVTTVSSARWNSSAATITLYGSSAGANFGAGATCTALLSGVVELA